MGAYNNALICIEPRTRRALPSRMEHAAGHKNCF